MTFSSLVLLGLAFLVGAILVGGAVILHVLSDRADKSS